MKKLKKLVLKREFVVNLTNSEMKSLHGGYYGDNGYGLPGSSTIPLSCLLCTYGCVCDSLRKDKYPYPPPGPTEYGGHTAPPRCCEFGCCETIGC